MHRIEYLLGKCIKDKILVLFAVQVIFGDFIPDILDLVTVSDILIASYFIDLYQLDIIKNISLLFECIAILYFQCTFRNDGVFGIRQCSDIKIQVAVNPVAIRIKTTLEYILIHTLFCDRRQGCCRQINLLLANRIFDIQYRPIVNSSAKLPIANIVLHHLRIFSDREILGPIYSEMGFSVWYLLLKRGTLMAGEFPEVPNPLCQVM